jgi:hypothetical protein
MADKPKIQVNKPQPKMQDDVKTSWKTEVTDAIYNTAADTYNAAKASAQAAGAAVAATAKKAWGEGSIYGKGPYKPGTNKRK